MFANIGWTSTVLALLLLLLFVRLLAMKFNGEAEQRDDWYGSRAAKRTSGFLVGGAHNTTTQHSKAVGALGRASSKWGSRAEQIALLHPQPETEHLAGPSGAVAFGGKQPRQTNQTEPEQAHNTRTPIGSCIENSPVALTSFRSSETELERVRFEADI